jgi:hypothetical protein
MRQLLAAAALLALTAPAAANDGIAAYGLGGVELARSFDIEIVREDLFISREEVRVRYEFRNTSKADIVSLVAFPLPPFSANSWYDFAVPVEGSPNYVGFTVTVDGKALEPQVQTRATMSGVDITDMLTGLKIPLQLPGLDLDQQLSQLPQPQWQELAQSGAVAAHASERILEALWSIETLFYWKQAFPAGGTVIVEHSYRPIKGGFWVYVNDYRDQRDDPLGWPVYYCLDEAAHRSLEDLLAQAGEDEQPLAHTVEYVLMTAHTWAGDIGTFHLTIDTGAPDALLSVCDIGFGQTRLQQTGATTYEVTLRDWSPTRDLAILIVPVKPE